MAMPWSPIVPETRMRSPGRAVRIDSVTPSRDHADAGSGDENLVALAAIHDLGIAGNQGHAGLGAACRMECDDAPKVVHRQAFFENECGREEQRPGAADRQIVDGAVHGQLANVAAGEEEGPHHEGIGGERDAAGAVAAGKSTVA